MENISVIINLFIFHTRILYYFSYLDHLYHETMTISRLFFGLLLLLLFTTCRSSSETISCRDQTDYHVLLFRICEKSVYCSRIYYIDPTLDTGSSLASNINTMEIRKLRDFTRFNHQMERVVMFDVYNYTDISQNNSMIASARHHASVIMIMEKEKILSKMLPSEWLAETRIIFSSLPLDSNIAPSYCSEIYDIMHPENKLFIYSVLMALQTFKLFISEEFSCADPNEKLYLTNEGVFKCICSKGKTCNSESNFATILEVLMIFIATGLFLWAGATFFSTFMIQNQIQSLKKQ